jgi:hypothetical protein
VGLGKIEQNKSHKDNAIPLKELRVSIHGSPNLQEKRDENFKDGAYHQ